MNRLLILVYSIYAKQLHINCSLTSLVVFGIFIYIFQTHSKRVLVMVDIYEHYLEAQIKETTKPVEAFR